MRDPREAGASASLASDNEASTLKAADTQLDPVGVFAPWAAGEERELRLRLHKARDVATARATRSRQVNSRTLFWFATDLASSLVFERIPNEDLEEAIENLARLFLVAGWIERAQAPDDE